MPRIRIETRARFTMQTQTANLIEPAEPIRLSERDTLKVLDLLLHPSEPPARLVAALKTMPVEE